MIYCVPLDQYPNSPIEELVYHDENELEWRISRVENGFYVRYFGPEYFKEDRFECQLSNGTIVVIRNTNCIQFKAADFDTFCIIRDILKDGFTDDIWDVFQDSFTERFEHDLTILESEKL